MNAAEFSALVFAGSLGAGFLGSLTGLGGGIIIVPLLTLVFGVDMRYAMGASLISVIATSSGAASAYVREGYSNVRIGLFLEMATASGALMGAAAAMHVPTSALAVIFGITLLWSAFGASAADPACQSELPAGDSLGAWLRLNGSFPSNGAACFYEARRVPLGFALMTAAGALSGLLGIGSGAAKVLAMDRAMGLPFKVSTTTSNFMIGVTAAASAGVYYLRGDIEPMVAGPVAAGIVIGATAGSRLLPKLENRTLRILFVTVLLVVSAQMVFKGVRG